MYKQHAVHRGTRYAGATLNEAKESLAGLLKVGETFELVRLCDRHHRRSPLETIVRRFAKILILRVCDRCDRILRSRTRVVFVGGAMFDDEVVKFDPGPCDSRLCQELVKDLAGVDPAKWEAEMRDWEEQSLFRTSEYPELEKFRYRNLEPVGVLHDLGRAPEDYLQGFNGDVLSLTPEERTLCLNLRRQADRAEPENSPDPAVRAEAAALELDRFLEEERLDGYHDLGPHVEAAEDSDF
jgi:hypothetical protein